MHGIAETCWRDKKTIQLCILYVHLVALLKESKLMVEN